MTIQPDFQNGRFAVTNAPQMKETRDCVSELERAIAQKPGMSQNELIKEVRIGRNKAIKLLNQYKDKLWRSEPGPNRSDRYFPVATGTAVSRPPDTDGTVVPLYAPLKGGTAVQPG